jgi:hypothetical protein
VLVKALSTTQVVVHIKMLEVLLKGKNLLLQVRGMAPFEALCGRRCRTPLNWAEPGERMIFGPDLVTEVEEIVQRIQSNLKATRARQESYANKRR